MGIDASKSADRNRSSIKLRRKDFRTLLCENLERRDLMAVDGPRLLSIAPNSGEIFSTTSPNSLNESPRELVLRFDALLDPTTIQNGIRITRAGGDGAFGATSPAADVIVPPAFLNFSDPANQRVVVARFAQPLLDDLYRVEVFGVNLTSSPAASAIKDVNGLSLKTRRAGTDRDTYEFNLELGAKIVAVVPQPVTRSNTGALVQARDQIEVYFDSTDRLYTSNVSTGQVSPNPTVVDLSFYQLHADRGTVSNVDDAVINPTKVDYIAGRNMVVLTFAQNIDQLQANDTSFRLRVGTNEVKPSAPTTVAPATDPGSTFLTARNLGTFASLSSLNIQEEIVNSAAFPLDFPGAPDTPGTREVDDDPAPMGPASGNESHHLLDTPDTDGNITIQLYNFNKVNQLGIDRFGQPFFNSISPEQEQRAREIFEIYSSIAGIQFVETDSSGWTIATAPIDGVGGAIGVAGNGLARMDAAESWWDGPGPADDPTKDSWIAVATHEIGHLLGLGHATELPPGTNMAGAFDDTIFGGEPAWLIDSPVEGVLPGAASEVNLKYMFRPDSRDIDMYRFVVGAGSSGEFTAEVIAERLPDSSFLDTSISLYRENVDGTREIISTNDDYFSEDSFLKLNLAPGVYYLGVSASGNRDFNPEITDSGLGGTSEGSYSLRTSFRPLEAASITDVSGSELDGDGDGLAGGVYSFWFQAAAPNGEQTTQRRTLFVDKVTGVAGGNGSRATPFLTIQAAFAAAQPGDIVRLVPNGGLDGNVLTAADNNAFEVGTGGLGNQPLRDGSTMNVPKGVTVMVDAGVLFKMGRTAIGVGSSTSSGDRSQANLQVLGTPERSVLFTSYTDESLGIDTDSLPSTPLAGDWGGVIFRNALDRAEGRNDEELRGRFVNYVGFADMRYGGGQVSIDGQNTVITPLHMITARPTLAYNTITRSASAAISANPDSFEETTFTTARYQAETVFTPDYSRVGPDIYGNTVTGNSVNGLFVRIETLPGQSTTGQTVSGRWDDIDIVHVITDTLTLNGTPGGAYFEQTPPSLGGVLTAAGGAVGNLVPGVSYSYRMTFVDSNGNEGVASASTAAFVLPAGNRAIRLNNLPQATAGFVARKIYRSDNGGAFQLVAELDRSSTILTDTAVQRTATLNAAPGISRARLDASLTIDPGMVVKLQSGRIVADVGAQLVAEGSETLPIVFTSRQDDRFGAGGTFDTNNDVSISTPRPGDWGGLYFGRISTGSLDSVTVSFGGGITSIAGTFAGFNAIEVHQADVRITNSLIERNASGIGGTATANRQGAEFNTPAAIFARGSQPIIVDNIIRDNNAPAISIDANSMSGESVVDTGRYIGLANRYAAITENKGPLLRGNALGGNTINGMSIRGGTLNTESVWDDTDIVHVVEKEILVPDLFVFGGLKLQSSPNESLVVKFGAGAGLTSNGRPLEIDDRIGGTLQVIGAPGFPVILTSLADDSAGAGFDPNGRAQTDTNNDGTSSSPTAGSWRSLRIAEFSNDRNVVTTTELEPAQSTGAGVNAVPSTAQYLGILAPNEKSGDDNSRLGFTISGVINNVDDLDIYSFRGTAGSNVWLDIDRTNISLDSVIEIIDSNGVITAQSDNSFDESAQLLPLFSNPAAIDGRFVNPMPVGPLSPRNGGSGTGSLANTFADFYSTNPLDAGMRLVLPGTKGTVNTYFVRVRSSNIDSRVAGVNRADLQDASKVLDGKTEGQYQLQIRLREIDEFGGASVSLADVRYATNAIEVLGMPTHSPLVGEAVELSTNNNQIGNALDLGNLANTDRGALSVGGELTAQDVDWYKFSVNQVSLQSGGLVQHLSAVIDVDYADGLGRANTSLWLFYDDRNGLGSGTNTGIRLVAFGNDSNIADDFGAPLQGSDVDDLSRGSAGVLDAFLGNIELPSGDYYLAITSNELASDYLSQFYRADAGGNPLTRVEPVNSVARIIEDRFGGSTANSTAIGALQTAFTGSASGATPNAIPYNLADVVLFVSQTAPGADTSELISINPVTGRQVSLVSRFPFVEDITVRGDGTIHGSRSPQVGIVQDSNSGGILTVDSAGNGTTTATTTTSGIVTFELDQSVTPPAPAQALTPGLGNTRSGRGMEFLGLTYPQLGSSSQFLYASASRVGTAPADGMFTFTTTGGVQRDAKNYIYKLDPTSLAAVSAPQNDRAAGPPDTRLQGAGTSIVERAYVNTSLDAGPVRNEFAQTIMLSDATSSTAPSLLSGDRVTIQTSDLVNHTFQWTAVDLSATLVADTLPQTQANNLLAATPTNFFRDGMSFELTSGANTQTFEIETGRVLQNNFVASAALDGYTFTVRDANRRITFELDSNNQITAGNARIVFDNTNTTQFQFSQAVIAAINSPSTSPATWAAKAFLLPGTNRISLTGDIELAVARGNSPFTLTELKNNFPALGALQTYDGATFTVVDFTGDTVTFEFDTDGTFANTNTPITISASSSEQFITQAMSAAINFPTTIAALNWDVQSIFTTGSDTLRILGDRSIAITPSDATIVNPIMAITDYGAQVSSAIPNTPANILVSIEEFYTNLDNSQFLPQPSTPGAMDELIASINGAAMGITASAVGNRLVLTGATGGDFTNITTMSFNSPTPGFTPLFFDFTDSAAVLTTTLFNAILPFEPLAETVTEPISSTLTGTRIWLPPTTAFVQASTDDRRDTNPRNQQLSAPRYGDVTGIAFAGNTMFGVSDQGDLYKIGVTPTNGVNRGFTTFNPDSSSNAGDFVETIYNTDTNQRVRFVSLVAGPRNAESGLQFSFQGRSVLQSRGLSAGLSQILFGIDTTGVLYAFDTSGRPAYLFPDGQWFIQTDSTSPSGLAFSNLDVNLWHQSANRGTDAGHGRNISFDGSRQGQQNGGSSLYFGFDNPNDAQKQPGDFSGINNPIAGHSTYDPARENTYDFPGGAKGSVISDSIDLSNYSAGDKPTLYFNYYLKTENANADTPGNATLMKDAFRIFASDSTGEWQLLGTNNSQYDATRLAGNRDELDYPFELDNPLAPNALNRQISELFDAGSTFNGQTAPDNWRQARIDLSRFAGQKDLRIRFDMSTSGSFNVGVGGGVELTAVPGSDIPTPVAQRQFTLRQTIINPAPQPPTFVDTDFEFDFGLMLQIPSGARLDFGDQFEVDGEIFTFANDNVGNNILFNPNEDAETIAARILPKLTALGLNAIIDPVTPSIISVMDAVNPAPFVSATLPANFVLDTPGTGANQQVLVNRGMTAIEVRDAIRVAMARAFNAVGQENNLESIRAHDRSIILFNRTILDPGPLLTSGSLQGDEYGEAVSGQTNVLGRGAQRGQNNRFEGVYVDDIIIGFAERGEMVTYQDNSATSVTSFSKNPRHEPAPGYAEIETGTYQVEIRRGATYGAGGSSFPNLVLANTFDTNDRSAQQVSLIAPRGSQISDGQIFQLSTGTTIATYEFDDTSIVSGNFFGVSQGNVRVPFSSADSAATVGQKMRDAINSAASRSTLDVTAGMSDGTVLGGAFVGLESNSRIVHIHSTSSVASNNFGGVSFGGSLAFTASNPTTPGFILFGVDEFQFNEAGDQNRDRDQGQILISSNIIRDVSGVGIVIDAGTRNSTLAPLSGVLPHPGAARNLLQFNATGLVPGPVIINNLIYSAAVGGILFSGDQRSATSVQASVPFGRIVNNTIVGLNGTGTGINVTQNASPTLLNNIVASNAVGINVDASSSTTVIGSILYKGNTNNVTGSAGLGNKPQLLSASDPLFVNAAGRNYYLAAGTRAIDSSADSQNDRQEMTTVRQVLGIPDSPILAPDFDLTGQLRVDDTSVSSPDGTGANPFKDRGAYDRADFFGPVAIIQVPLDNDPDILDVDRSNTYIRLSSGTLDSFSILLYESEGTGPDAATVTDNSVALTENGRLLRSGVDYVFGYNASSRTIRFTPLSGFWRADSTYEVTLVNKLSHRLSMPSGSALVDGQKLTFNVGSTPVVMEFDTGDGVTSGAIPVLYQSTFTPAMVAGALLKALRANNLVNAGVTASAMAIDQLLISGVNNLAISPSLASFTSVAIPAITDVAQNPLQANRSSSLTQFTIVMPEVGVDYGDAIRRASSAATSGTLQADNGARHALFPSDVPVLALGQFADSDLDGKPSPAADGDDLGSAFSFSAGVPLSLSNRGATKVVVSTPVFPAIVGKTFSITDAVGKSVTFEFTNTTAWATATSYAAGVFITNGGNLYQSLSAHTSGVFATDLAAANWVLATKDTAGLNIGINLTVGMTAQQTASTIANSIFSNAIVRGLITGITPVADGNTVALGGTPVHVFNFSNSGGFVTKQASGSVGIVVASNVAGLAAGQTFTIQDGSGRSVTFQFINSASPTPLLAGNTAISLDLTAGVQTQASVTAAVLTAINDSIAAGKLRLPPATIEVGSVDTITVNADDEDGVQFKGLFNAKTPSVSVGVTTTDTGYLDAWVDWNQDNDFDDVGEQVIVSEPVIAGLNTFLVSTPAAAAIGYTTARFRLSATGGLITTGLGIGGEVEDHLIEVLGGTPPTAVNDNFTVLEDTTLNIAAAGVLTNDSDADGDPFSVFDSNLIPSDGVQPLVAPRHAKSFTLRADGSFSYTPADNFFGTLLPDGSIDFTDTFVYEVTDPRLVSSRPATVTITITPVNDAPFGTDSRQPINEDNNGIPFVFSAANFGFNDPTDLPASNSLLEVQILTLPNASEGVLKLGLTNVVAGQVIPVAAISTLTFTPASDLNGLNKGSFTFKVRDNGGTANSGIDTSVLPNTFAFDINAINDAPSFTLPSATINLSEDPGAQNLTGFITNVQVGPSTAADEIATQLVTFRVRALDPTRFAVQPAVNPLLISHGGTGNLTFTLAPDVNNVNSGPILVELQADDQGGPGTFPNGPLSLRRTVTINVAQVNDPPTFTISQTIFNTTEDAPRTIIPGFVSNVLVGPATAIDETANQTAVPTVRAVNPSLFSFGPTLNGSGDLEFQLAPDVNSLFTGALEIVVTVTDDGTPVEAASKTLTIVATAINDSPSFVINPLKTTINVDEDNEILNNQAVTIVDNFALNLRQGPATARDEAGLESVAAQTLSFDPVIISNPSIFAQLPTIDAAGRLIFRTEANRSGSSVFVIRLRDSGLAGPPPNSNTGPTATYTINIRSVNDAPEFSVPASTTVDEDQGVATIPGFATGIRPGPASAVDESTQELTFVVTAADPSVFTVQPTIQADGTLVFQTAKDVNNNTRDADGALLNRLIVVSLRDNGSSTSPNVNQSANQTFTLNINPVNDPPIPSVHVRPGTEDTLASFSAASIINAASPDRPDAPGPADESAQIVRMTQIERTTDRGGVVTPVFGTGLQSDQIISFTYNPPLNYVGDDLIRYVVTDDGSPQQSATGTLTVQLAPVNDPPQFIPGSDIAVQEDSVAFSAPWATAILAGPASAVDELNGVPPLTPAQTVSFAITTDNNALFAVLPAVSPTGVLTFTLAKDANGRAIVDVVAVDSGLGVGQDINRSAVAKLTIVANPVNDAPGFNVIGNVTVDEDSNRYSAAAIKDIVPAEGMNSTPSTGNDEVGQVISIITSNNNTSLFSVQPTVSSTGILEFVPAQDAFGTAIVSVVARDNGANTLPNVNQSAAKTFTITLTPKNDAPIGVNDRYTTGEDTVLTVNAPGLLSNDRDVDLPNDTISVESSQATSTLGAIVSVLPNGQFTYDSRTAAQLQRLVNGETAVDTFTYTIKDAAGVLSNLATVTITVSGNNDTPIAVDDNLSIPFGTSQLLNVLANDRDPDTSIDPRTVEIGQLASHGTAVAQSTGRIDYRPVAGFRGVDTFTYRVRDALGAISNEAVVTVTVNTPPVAVADFVRTSVETPVVIDVLRNDNDQDGTLNPSSVVIGSGPDVGSATVQTNGSIRYAPPAGFAGTATLQYSVLDNDGLASNFATVSIVVGGSVHQNPVNNLDVDADGFVSPIDVLILVNDINFNNSRVLPTTLATPPYLDPDGDGRIGPLDVLAVINFINSRGNAGAGEGEASMATLGYSQEIVRAPSKQEIIVGLIQAEYEASTEGQIDLAVSSVASDSMTYGPSLVTDFNEEDADDSLESYLASWTTKPKRSASALDSVFADEDWM